MEKIVNFRDLGGIATGDGRIVKKGNFFRCAAISNATDKDIEKLNMLKIKSIYDFRDQSEMSANEIYGRLNSDYYNNTVNLDSARICNLSNNRTLRNALIPFEKEDMRIAYRNLPFGNDSYRQLIGLINKGNVPVLFHCSVGKDRTGVAAAVILLMLGASREEIIQDYVKTQQVLPYIINAITGDINRLFRRRIIKAMMPIFLADESYITTSLDEIMARYDTAEDYFVYEYGLAKDDINYLRDRYTTEP